MTKKMTSFKKVMITSAVTKSELVSGPFVYLPPT